MGILDNVFGGPNGVYKALASTLGGTATIIYVTPGEYNEQTDSCVETTSELEVSFLCESNNISQKTSYPVSNGGFSMAGGLIFESNDLAGVIPYAELTEVPRENRDRIVYLGETYRITQTKKINVGSTHVGIAIVAKK